MKQSLRAAVNNMINTGGKRNIFGKSDFEEKFETVFLMLWKFETWKWINIFNKYLLECNL